MCGILLIAEGLGIGPLREGESEGSHGVQATSVSVSDFLEGLQRRGPDAHGGYTIQVQHKRNYLLFFLLGKRDMQLTLYFLHHPTATCCRIGVSWRNAYLCQLVASTARVETYGNSIRR